MAQTVIKDLTFRIAWQNSKKTMPRWSHLNRTSTGSSNMKSMVSELPPRRKQYNVKQAYKSDILVPAEKPLDVF